MKRRKNSIDSSPKEKIKTSASSGYNDPVEGSRKWDLVRPRDRNGRCRISYVTRKKRVIYGSTDSAASNLLELLSSTPLHLSSSLYRSTPTPRHFLFSTTAGFSRLRPCNAAGRPNRPPSPLPPPLAVPLGPCWTVAAATIGTFSGSSQQQRQERASQWEEEGEEAVAAALVHLVLRGRDIGLPRSTLPVRYSFPLLLCIIHGYPAYVRVHPPPSCLLFLLPHRIFDSPPPLFRSYTVLCSPFLHPSGFLSIYIYIYV